MIPVPVLTPYLSSLWLGLVTPLYARIGRKLIQSIVHSTVVRNAAALDGLRRPADRRRGGGAPTPSVLRSATTPATRWSDALSSSGAPPAWGGVQFGSRLVDSRKRERRRPTPRSRLRAHRADRRRIQGGTRGTPCGGCAGSSTCSPGALASGGDGDPPMTLRVGDAVDFWRVEALEPGRRLRLAAEMKLPGRAWLEFEVTGDGAATTIRQTATFDPVGLPGRIYWYSLLPLHQLVFGGMLRGIAKAALRE
jgi:hypothetical protein